MRDGREDSWEAVAVAVDYKGSEQTWIAEAPLQAGL